MKEEELPKDWGIKNILTGESYIDMCPFCKGTNLAKGINVFTGEETIDICPIYNETPHDKTNLNN